jgi:ketosteroid isomerase-like protein
MTPPANTGVRNLVQAQGLYCFCLANSLSFSVNNPERTKRGEDRIRGPLGGVPRRLVEGQDEGETMQRKALWLALGVLLATTLLRLSAQDSEKSRVLSLENAWNEAEKHRDANALSGLIAPTFTYTDIDGSFMDKEQFLASIRGSHASQIVNESMKAESYGTVIVVTGSYREQGSENGKSYTRRGRFTDTWIEKNGQWLCVASHETLIAH